VSEPEPDAHGARRRKQATPHCHQPPCSPTPYRWSSSRTRRGGCSQSWRRATPRSPRSRTKRPRSSTRWCRWGAGGVGLGRAVCSWGCGWEAPSGMERVWLHSRWPVGAQAHAAHSTAAPSPWPWMSWLKYNNNAIIIVSVVPSCRTLFGA